MTRSEVDHLQTQPLSPVAYPVVPHGVIPSQRRPGPSGSVHPPGPGRSDAVVGRGERGVLASRGMFVTAAVLTGCALLSSIWGTVATSRAGGGRPGTVLSSSGPGESAVAGKPARGAIRPVMPVLAPGEFGGDGIYEVGSTLRPGTYRTAGPSPAAFDNCYWERSKDESGEQKAVIAKGLATGPVTVMIKSTDKAFKSSGCETWTRVQ